MKPPTLLSLLMRTVRIPSLLVLCSSWVFPQQPSINPGGIVNAASFASNSTPTTGIVPGSIVALFGQNLAASTQTASSTPLPTTLVGTSVTINGVPAPLFFVSPGQINLEVPNSVPRGQSISIIVTSPAGTGAPTLVNTTINGVGLFTQSVDGCGQGAIQNLAADYSTTLNTPANSVSPGDYITVYGTGIGDVYFPPPDGQPAGVNPLSFTPSRAGALVGFAGFDIPAFVNYSGRAPGLVGVDQFNIRIPDNAPEGCAVPLTVYGLSQASQPVLVSIHRGGGPCQDAPKASFGSLHWQKTVSTGPDPSASTSQESFTATFAAAPQNLVVPPPAPAQGCRCSYTVPPGPRRCPGAKPATLQAGSLMLQGLSSPLTITPSLSDGDVVYSATLPEGSFARGSVGVQGTGGPDVGPFQASLSIPGPITITTPLQPGTAISYKQPFQVNWTGGSPDAVVRMQVIEPTPLGYDEYCECAATANTGSLTLGTVPEMNTYVLPLPPNDYVRVVISVAPASGTAGSFSAPGLTQGGMQDWKYEYQFSGLSIKAPPTQ